MSRRLRWQYGSPGEPLFAVHRSETQLRPLVPSVAAAEAAVWTAIAESGVMRGLKNPDVDFFRIMASDKQAAAAKEPPCGDVAAAIKILRRLGRQYAEDAPEALLGLARGQVTWPSDGSVSSPVSMQEEQTSSPVPSVPPCLPPVPPCLPPPSPMPPAPTAAFDHVSAAAVPWGPRDELHSSMFTTLRGAVPILETLEFELWQKTHTNGEIPGMTRMETCLATEIGSRAASAQSCAANSRLQLWRHLAAME